MKRVNAPFSCAGALGGRGDHGCGHPRVLCKWFIFLKVDIAGAALEKGEHRGLIGNCSAKIRLVR